MFFNQWFCPCDEEDCPICNPPIITLENNLTVPPLYGMDKFAILGADKRKEFVDMYSALNLPVQVAIA